MCGIVGVICEERVTDVKKMLNLIAHRGQDSSQFQNFDRFGSIGINRPSIIDVERGNQPVGCHYRGPVRGCLAALPAAAHAPCRHDSLHGRFCWEHDLAGCRGTVLAKIQSRRRHPCHDTRQRPGADVLFPRELVRGGPHGGGCIDGHYHHQHACKTKSIRFYPVAGG